MRWTPGGSSSDVEDRRGGGGFGGGGMPFGIGGAVVLLLLSLIFGRNFFSLVGGSGTPSSGPAVAAPDSPQTRAEEPMKEFVTFVLNDTQSTWEKLLSDQAGVPYRHAKLVLFRDRVDSSCGFAQAASGPFYCPTDEKVYIDLGFYQELKERFGAPGDFAQAYVVAHEIGHHVQKILDIEPRVHQAMESDRSRAREYSVRLELQADCFAGVWANSTNERKLLESGDVEEGLNAAAAVGDDRIQRSSGRSVNPDAFTHGSSKQRAEWFRRGFDSGKISACNTFQGLM
jgi:predicted metalloprotease